MRFELRWDRGHYLGLEKVCERAREHLHHMKIHRLVAFGAGTVFHESRTTALDLHTTPSLLLDVLHVDATVANDLSAEVETWNWLEIN